MRGMKGATIRETILDGNIIPSENLERIQVVDDRESIKFVEAGNDAAVFNIGQAADAAVNFAGIFFSSEPAKIGRHDSGTPLRGYLHSF